MPNSTANVVICGAGIAGISAAYHLAVKQRVKNVVLVDERAPLSLTSDKSTECYRNWWPGPGDAMVALMNRSIDIVEDLARASGNIFHLNRRGYLYATADSARIDEMRTAGEEAAALGAGEMRVHTGGSAYIPAPDAGFENQPTGSDLILDVALIRECFPYLTKRTIAVLHARRCGWLSAQQLGMYLLERAKEHGVKFIDARVGRVDTTGSCVRAVRLSDGTTIATDNFVIAAGPFLKQVARMIGVDMPVFSELHAKVAFRDDARAFPRNAPLLIWIDSQKLPWSDEERAMFAESEETRGLLNEFPSGVHARPEGGSASPMFLVLWTYHTERVEPVLPIRFDPRYPEIVLRGLATMLPALETYFGKMPRMTMDGGYYTKTPENRPLIGRLPVQGAFVIAALSGYGIMASCAAGELVAAHVTGDKLPTYAPAFALERYADPVYQELLRNWGASGQL
ncbi:MAG: FAD-binding oxidoreductase [Chloroflexota bacterium]|nr:FAD-binding oxidoreductase [Chloroflexota bacterium]